MTNDRLVLVDGEFTTETFAKVDLASPMWTSGRSLFETLLVHPTGKWGLYRERDHIVRLMQSARALGWAGLPHEQTLSAWLMKAAASFRQTMDGFGRLRMTAAWTGGEDSPTVFVTVVPYVRASKPLRLVTTEICLPSLGSLTTPKSGNRVVHGLAEMIARQREADEALLVGPDGLPLEGAKSNWFVVRGDEVLTPPLDQGVLPGVTRARLFELATGVSLRLKEEKPDVRWLEEASGYFMTNALWGVRPVGRLDARTLDPNVPAILAFKEAYDQDVREYLRTSITRMKLL